MAHFDYSQIPRGYYDSVYHHGNAIRRCWHIEKFERILSSMPDRRGGAVLDIGCFSGTFLSLVPVTSFSRQVGIDLLPGQVEFAQAKYGGPHREFRALGSLDELGAMIERFDCITLIEVIEHLNAPEIRRLFTGVAALLKPGGKLLVSTPNYASAWPIIEAVLNRVSDVTYEEQHVTKFTYFNFRSKLARIVRPLRSQFSFDFLTTSHLITPFLAWISLDLACRASRLVPHAAWHMPFGNLLIARMTRRN